ncbi:MULTISPECIES: site-specific tyrosine recombinase XerD [unclassified Enterococcus]|uniref:site-specific tyrosine recombinase XerD n=1 Tax=unclassified Enterococcus TaxID=2608891 RepID=UPI0015531A12|nr:MULTISPECIES: site-specific tyrosine recombinase XerD [unclassified Enterococcus]MBS7577387.1 site-specific tyrosine recombinase XerD [Enterococcus sp. MMGLQ5-2]MBS7584794.1 site-specific tyrosine recombinase XerD [Enterococcus sp. MMGLQ5-1]NPD12649.1 site-specific tyrosine recombinase XerD [Enterococcus sp. MMGLQ5-1]NPD37221.1 site-specific tyrosine recombinase XerD [Enterococcus sp. MMGLQ5-2]
MLIIINQFLESKSLSKNSYDNYRYDLIQFASSLQNRLDLINQQNVELFQLKLQKLNLSNRTIHRKTSIINQFLFYLYQHQMIKVLIQIKGSPLNIETTKPAALIDFKAFYHSDLSLSQLLVVFILETGLNIQDILKIKSSDVNLDYGFLQVEIKGQNRVIELVPFLIEALRNYHFGQVFLFENHGHAFTRQWGYLTIKKTLFEQGFQDLSPAKLREQYILRQVKLGKTIHQIKEQLGLATMITLEPYFRGKHD